jgi:hypothetical protein
MEATRNENSQCHAEYWASLRCINIDHIHRVPIFFLSAILASLTLLVSPVSAQQEQQSQQEGLSGADAAAADQSKTADEEKTDQNALPHSHGHIQRPAF